MPRLASSLSQYDPVFKTPSSTTNTVTCVDFHTLPGGNIGGNTQYLRLPNNDGADEVDSIEYHGDIPAESTSHDMEQALFQFAKGTMDDMAPADPAYLEQINEITPPEAKKDKRATYTPLHKWLSVREVFLVEALRLEGRGDHVAPQCPLCRESEALYRCTECFGGRLLCQSCTVSTHLCNPLHIVEKWTDDTYFEQTTLRSLGLAIQLGHRLGERCQNPKRAHKDGFIVIDLNGIHEVDLFFCDCHGSKPYYCQILRYNWHPASIDRPQTAATNRVLKFFHLLNFESKASMFEFYSTLARLTDNTGTKLPRDKYEALVVMIRETRNLKDLKRGGRGHKEGGAAGTQPGELATLCPACPQPGINLEPGWELAPPHERPRLFLAMDANFCLRRRDISSEAKDPSLSDGCMYTVPHAEYRDHLVKHGPTIVQPKSDCSNHQAVNAERAAKGYAATGIAAVDCARHDMKRPLAVGDLQKGERFVNMDFLFFKSLQGSKHLDIVVSYDICCQWSRHLWERMSLYSPEMSIPEEKQSNFRFLVPKFHLPSHIVKCQTRYSFNFTPRVGRTDGEAPERGWSRINGLARSTTEMGPGSRRDAMNSFFSDGNWKKTTNIARALRRDLAEAEKEAKIYSFLHGQVCEGLEREKMIEWEQQLADWGDDETKPNPFEKKFAIITEDGVRKRLNEEEKAAQEDDTRPRRHKDVTAVDLITRGLDLEEQQRQILVKSVKFREIEDYDTRSATQMKNRLRVLHQKILAWMEIQHVYASFLNDIREQDAKNSPLDVEPPATAIKLYLPSAAVRQYAAEDIRLVLIEYQLRCAQADDALQQLRDALRLRSYLFIDKKRNRRGQIAHTRSRTIIERINEKVTLSVAKYRTARRAISSLAPILRLEWEDAFPALRDSDIRGFNDDDHPTYANVKLTPEEKRELLSRTSKKSRRERFQVLSWIWRKLGAHRDSSGDQIIEEDHRIEFCRSKARADRWSEEVGILRDEMGRVARFFQYRSKTWRELGEHVDTLTLQVDSDDGVIEGLKAYAIQQAKMFDSMEAYSQKLWRTPYKFQKDVYRKWDTIMRGRSETEVD